MDKETARSPGQPPLRLLVRVRLLSAGRALAFVWRRERLKAEVVLVLGSGIWLAVLGGLVLGLRDLEAYPPFKGMVVSNLLAMFFFVVMMMLVFSSTVVSYGALFEQQEVGFLLAAGLRPADIYTYRLSQAIVFSSWATVVMGLPVIIAYGLDMKLAWHYYPLAAVTVVPFLLLSAAVGGLAALAGGRYIARYRRALVAVLVVAGALGGLYVAMTLPTFSASERDFVDEWVFRILGWFTFSRRLYYPSAWMTRGLEALVRGDFGGWLVMLYGLGGGALVMVQAGRLLAAGAYRRAFEEVGSMSVRQASRWNRPLWCFSRVLAAGNRPAAAVIYKDLALFLRDPLQWGQAAIFLGLILIYFVGLRRFGATESSPLWRLATVDLSFMSVILTVSTFTTRFGFPLVSMELRAPWALASGLSRRRLLYAKVAWTSVLAAASSAGLLLFGARSLGLSAAESVVTGAAAVGAAFALATCAVSLGAVFPEKGRRSPSEMVSSFGGTLTLLASLLLVSVYVAGYHLAMRRWLAPSPFAHLPVGEGALSSLPLAPLCAAGMLLMAGVFIGLAVLAFGRRALEKLEWA